MPRDPRIIIIGAGIGGLTAAALLSRHFPVSVFEQHGAPGGKIRQITIDGRSTDAGPTVFTMRWVFEDIFEQAGESFPDAVELTKLDVLARHTWRDQSHLVLYADQQRSYDAIHEMAGRKDAENYFQFCKQTRAIYEALEGPFIRAEKPSILNLMARRNPASLFGINPFSTLWEALARRFDDPRLQQLFARYATYCGSSPYEAPATLMLIAHVEQEGVWALDGGMQSLANALWRIAEKNGADFHFNEKVDQVRVKSGRVIGVQLSNGEEVPARAVVLNGDPGAIATGALGEAARRAYGAPAPDPISQSAFTLTTLAKTAGTDLSMHNVFFGDDYRAEFDAVFQHKAIPEKPTTYVFAPDRICERSPPDSAERLFCLINAPALESDAANREEDIEECKRRIFEQLQACGLTLEQTSGPGVTTSPSDFATLFPGSRGALYGMASHGWRASFQRRSVKTRLPGLYMTGGGVHPGPGVPMAALSGKMAAKMVKAAYGST